MHYDWFEHPLVDKMDVRYNRVVSFFVLLEADCEAGTTYFPRVPPPPTWLEDTGRYASTEDRVGMAMVPRLGSGLLWMNMLGNGTGDKRTLHAGMPVTKGPKVGLNIWIKGRV